MQTIKKSTKLNNVCYDIRGPVLEEAKRMEEEGHRILKLNIGNPKPFGLDAPEEIIQDVIYNLPDSEGYADSKGLFSARKAIMQYAQQKNIQHVGIEDIIVGNGVSELIVMAMQVFNVSQDDWLFIVKLFNKANVVFREQGRSMQTVYDAWRSKFSGGKT